MRTPLRLPLAWALVAAAAAVGVAMTYSYLGAFLDPLGNARGLPIALVNEDAGAALGGSRLELGAQAVAALRSPRSPLGETVAWSPLPTRSAALELVRDDEAFAVVVLPRDYSRRLAALARPATGPAPAATVEVLTNPAAGSFARSAAEEAATRAVTAVSTRIAARVAAAGAAGTAAVTAHRVADAVEVRTSEAVDVGAKSARGLAPFYFALMLALTGFVGAVMISIGVEFLNGHLALDLLALRLQRDRTGLSRTALWRTKLALLVALAAVAGIVQTVLAVAVLGMPATNPVALGFFAVLGVAAAGTATLAFLVAFGLAGSLFGILFITIFGVPASAGPYPLELLPGFFRFLAEWLPLRYLTDGVRALVFLDGRLDAGLGTALVVLAGYVVGSVLLGGATALAIDRRLKPPSSRRRLAFTAPSLAAPTVQGETSGGGESR